MKTEIPERYKIIAMRTVSDEQLHRSDTVGITPLPDSFEVLIWNCNKKVHHPLWIEEFEELQEELSPSLMLLQEVDFHDSSREYLTTLPLHYAFFPNLRLSADSLGGVATLSSVEPITLSGKLSPCSEPFLNTRKPLIISSYALGNGNTLTVINLHGINFVRTSTYQKQLAQIKEEIENCSGAMIIAGDFNAWRHTRQNLIHALLNEFSDFKFKEVSFIEHTEHVKKAPQFIQSLFGEHHLDRIFYSSASLSLNDNSARAHHRINERHLISSDHQPLSCGFTVL